MARGGERECLRSCFPDQITLHQQVDHLDRNSQCALVHAALRGHMDVVKFLIQCDWGMGQQQQQSPQTQQHAAFTKSHAVQQALIAAASMGYTEVRRGRGEVDGRESGDNNPLQCGIINS